MTRQELMTIARAACNARSMRGALRVLNRAAKTIPRRLSSDPHYHKTWHGCFDRLIDGLKAGRPAYAIFSLSGNRKLPFASFSSVPIVDCPGYGECGQWCYSFKAWMYPSAYCRQLQNSLLLRFGSHLVRAAFRQLPHGSTIRLYVDGDFRSIGCVAMWMRLLHSRPDLAAYGYSKSWRELLEYHDRCNGAWPSNYVLNLSCGGDLDPNHPPSNINAAAWRLASTKWVDRMLSLPITRGWFVSAPIDLNGLAAGFKRYDDSAYHARVRDYLREHHGKRSASCGGRCGECGNGKPWCADDRLVNLTIGIGTH